MRNKKIKVMFVIDFIYTLAGGTENQLVKMVSHLDRSRFELHLMSLRETEWLEANQDRLDCTVKSFNIIRLRNPLNILTFLKIVSYIRTVKPDIVMTFFPLSNILGVIAARMAGVGTVVSTRRDYGLWLNWEHKLSIHVLRFANRFVSRIVVNAQSVKELTSRAESFDPDRIDVIYNGIVLNGDNGKGSEQGLKQTLGIPSDAMVVGIVGGLKPMKRHVIFIRAARHILRQGWNTYFIIVGDGVLRNELESYAEELGVRERVIFVGSQLNVIPYVRLFDVAVNCSANEGLSNAIMEYMSERIPCVVSDAGGNSELIVHGENGYVVPLDDDITLADRILALLRDKAARERFANEAYRIIASQMTVEQMIDKYDQYFLWAIAWENQG